MLDRVLAGGLIVIVSLTSDLLKGVSPTERGLLAVNVAKRGFSERYEKKFKFRLKVNICRTDNTMIIDSTARPRDSERETKGTIWKSVGNFNDLYLNYI